MSASACIAFFGVRYEITIDEFEDANDARKKAARKVGLKYYSGNFGGMDERYLLFIGAQVGILGPENEMEVTWQPQLLQTLMESTHEKLLAAGFNTEPLLYLQWEEDI